jgi:hypothetical protein
MNVMIKAYKYFEYVKISWAKPDIVQDSMANTARVNECSNAHINGTFSSWKSKLRKHRIKEIWRRDEETIG